MVLYLLSFFGGYLVGSIPTAYLIVRKKFALDVRTAGSGKVGGFNAFHVTQSKYTGYVVGILDGIKGLAATGIGLVLAPDSFWIPSAALLGAIAGHNYPIWLKFKGGRGLATAAGGFFLIGFTYTIVWCSTWVVVKLWKKDILTANIVAIAGTPFILHLLPRLWIEFFMIVSGSATLFLVFSWIASVELMFSHLDALGKRWKSIVHQRRDGK